MELGAAVVVPSNTEVSLNAIRGIPAHSKAREKARPIYSPRTPILGNDALQLWIERVRQLGVRSMWLASSTPDQKLHSSHFADLARQGVEKLLVIKLKSYAEMDLADLLRFHCEHRNPVTDAQDEHGELGVRLLDRCAMEAVSEEGSSGSQSESPKTYYQFQGYAKRLLSPRERQDLVRDALTGACAMRPMGTEIRDQVWIGEDADIEDSVRVMGPAYIGPRTIIRAGATIGPFAGVERDCVVDCGTSVERSTVLPCTYLGPGLLIEQSLVDGNCLEHLKWRTIVDLEPAELGHKITQNAYGKRGVRRNEGTKNGLSQAEHGEEWNAISPSPRSASSCWMRVEL